MYKTLSKNLQRWTLIENPEEDSLLEERNKKFNNFQKIKATSERIKIGKMVQCEVLSINEHGVIVTVNGVRGFIHISQLSNGWIKHPSAVVKKGQNLIAKVISKELGPNGIYKLRLTRKKKTRNAHNRDRSSSLR